MPLIGQQNGATLSKDQPTVPSRDLIVQRDCVASVYQAWPPHLDAVQTRLCQSPAAINSFSLVGRAIAIGCL